MDDWLEAKRERDKRFADLMEEGVLDRTPEQLTTVEEVAEFMELAYWVQGRHGGRLPVSVAKPDLLVKRVVELAGELGIRDARLRKVCEPLSVKRLEFALSRLESSGMIERRNETRTDKRGSLRSQRIWWTR